jgi:hypothetical protein
MNVGFTQVSSMNSPLKLGKQTSVRTLKKQIPCACCKPNKEPLPRCRAYQRNAPWGRFVLGKKNTMTNDLGLSDTRTQKALTLVYLSYERW